MKSSNFHSAQNEAAKQILDWRNEREAPAVHGQGCEIQLVFALEEQHFSPDLHNGRRVDGHGHAEQSQLRPAAGLAVPRALLAVEVLQSSPELESLESWEMSR